MTAADLATFRQCLGASTPPELGPGPRPGVQPAAKLLETVNGFLVERNWTSDRQQAARATALLWNDHLDQSHHLAQALPDANGSFLHAMMHRREPDYANAKYWFRRVGTHPSFPKIARGVEKLLGSSQLGESLRQRLILKQTWDASAFVDLCEDEADGRGLPGAGLLLEQIQVIEFDALLSEL